MQVPAWFRHAAGDRTADGKEVGTFSLAGLTALHTPFLSEGCADVPYHTDVTARASSGTVS